MDEEIEVEVVEPEQLEAPLLGPGDKLRRAREASGMTLEQVAAETRIPQRHLALIEAGNFTALPARTYAIGFSKNFARAVGLDEDAIGDEVRAELALDNLPARRVDTFEPGDPARVPGGNVIWIAGAAVLGLLVIGYFSYNSLFAPAAELPSLLPEEQPTQRAAAPRRAAAAQPVANGPVVFTALEQGVWVKFYDADGTQLMQKEMARGETYTVPADAKGPQLWTGRPDALRITVGGREIPRLASAEQIMKDVPVSAAALRARATSAPAPATTPTAASPAAARRPASPAPRAAARAARPAPEPIASAIAAAENDAAGD